MVSWPGGFRIPYRDGNKAVSRIPDVERLREHGCGLLQPQSGSHGSGWSSADPVPNSVH